VVETAEIDLQHWRSEVPDRWFFLRAVRGGSVPGLSPWLVDGYLLSVSSYHLLFIHVSVSKCSLFVRTPSYWIRAHLNGLIVT